MGHYKTDRHISSWKPKWTTTFLRGELCRSTLEARFGDILEHSGIVYEHEAVRFCVPSHYNGYANPDYLFNDPFHPGCLTVGEPKGGQTARAEEAMNEFEAFVNRANTRYEGKGLDISCYLLVKYKFLYMLMDGEEGYAGLYECPNCGGRHFYFLEVEHECPYCHADSTDFIFHGVKMNDLANDWNKEIWLPNFETLDKKTKEEQAEIDAAKAYENKVIEFMGRVRKWLGWDELLDGDNPERPLRIQTPYAMDGMYIPDFYYEELPVDAFNIGYATKPLVLISICEKADRNDKICLKHIRDLVASGDHEFVRHCVLNSEGWHVCDWTTDGRYVDGALYTCRDCGNHFIARRDWGCPYCGGDHCDEYHSVKKSDKERN